MGGLFGRSTSSKPTSLASLQVQQSTYGACLGRGWGRCRLPLKTLYATDFKAITHTQKAAGGKGGAPKTTSYTYQATLVLGISDGMIGGVRQVWRDTNVFASPAAAGFAGVALGSPTQAVWGFLTTNHPTEALAYSGTSYLYASSYAISDGGNIQNHSVEVDFPVQVAGLADANPADILSDFMVNEVYGWTVGLFGSLTPFSNYCLASGILLSPYIDAQSQASQFVDDLFAITNTGCCFTEGVLKVVPYGDTTISGNGATFVPNMTPQYDLGDDDFCDVEAPVRLTLVRAADAWNTVQIEFVDRSHDYNVNIATADDAAAIDLYGRRKDAPRTYHQIADPAVAQTVAQLVLQRALYIRRTYAFELPALKYDLLEPLDLVTLTDVTLGLNRALVRIIDCEESDDDHSQIKCTAEETLIGTASPAFVTGNAVSGYKPNFNVAPGSVSAPAIFNPPLSLTSGRQEAWIAVAGLGAQWGGCEVWACFDTVNYAKVGQVNAPARYGVTTGSFAAGSDPDTTHTLAVDLSTSAGQMLTATQADADRDATLCLVGSELVSYRDATLTSTYHYSLGGYLRRGRFGTANATAGAGATFVRLDDAIFKLAFTNSQNAASVRLKFPSFNVYGGGLEDISGLPFYTATPTVTPAPGLAGATLSATPTTFSSANGETRPALIVTGAAVTDLDAIEVLVQYRIVGGSNPGQIRIPVTPLTGGAWTGTIHGLVGAALYEVQAATIYNPPRTVVFSGWVSATGPTAGSTPAGIVGGGTNLINKGSFNDGAIA